MRLAALPMYGFAELAPAHDALWAAIAMRLRREGIAAPASLTHGADPQAIWTDPALLLGQTCGYPLVTRLKGRVALLATPCYSAPGCDGPFYRSAVVVRAGDPAATLADLHGRVCAVNDFSSQSGMNLLRAEIAPLAGGERFFRDTLITGAHERSVRAVAGGDADLAAIDCVTWAHLQHCLPEHTSGLRVLAWTRPSPGLPLITSLQTDGPTREALCRVLDQVALDPALVPARAALRLEGFRALKLRAYDEILAMEQHAISLGYPVLH